MPDLDRATATQIANIEKRTGRTSGALINELRASGVTKHSELRQYAMEQFGVGHGDGNLLAHLTRGASAASSGDEATALDAIYVGKKSHLRPIHEKLMAAIHEFGAFEVAPKKGYVSLRRKKQFAMLGPKTNERFELGLNLKEEITHPRIRAVPPGGMCQYVADISQASDVDAALIALVKRAYEGAG